MKTPSPEKQLAGFIAKFSPEIAALAAQATGVSLCFLQGAGLPDPDGLLRGSGNVVRNIRLESAAAHRLIIKSVSAKQRPRRAVATAKE